MSNTHTFLVDMKFDIELDGTHPDEIKGLLESAVQHLLNNGMITGDTPAYIDNQETEVIDAGSYPGRSIALEGRQMAKRMRDDAEYLENSDGCPKCGLHLLSDGDIEIDSDIAWLPITCLNENCNHEWEDEFHLIQHTDMERP